LEFVDCGKLNILLLVVEEFGAPPNGMNTELVGVVEGLVEVFVPKLKGVVGVDELGVGEEVVLNPKLVVELLFLPKPKVEAGVDEVVGLAVP
jgi:hypothetical protein